MNRERVIELARYIEALPRMDVTEETEDEDVDLTPGGWIDGFSMATTMSWTLDADGDRWTTGGIAAHATARWPRAGEAREGSERLNIIPDDMPGIAAEALGLRPAEARALLEPKRRGLAGAGPEDGARAAAEARRDGRRGAARARRGRNRAKDLGGRADRRTGARSGRGRGGAARCRRGRRARSLRTA